jgi:hypothetical protein
MEVSHRHCWNFAVTTAVIGISPLPSLEFCHCHSHQWNFTTAVLGILPLPSLEFCRCNRFATAIATAVIISPMLSLFRQCCHCFATAVIVSPLLFSTISGVLLLLACTHPYRLNYHTGTLW